MARTGFFLEDLKVGQSAEFAKTISEADITLYAAVSGDTNPLHIDQTHAETTMFKGRIAHGMLSAGLISAVLGTLLPGPGAVYVSQTLKFKAPVRIGDTVVARCTLTEIETERKRVKFACECRVADRLVIEGEAVLLVPVRA
jgi:3-hydroxybutyryl-CoA dehydratase